MAEPKYWKTLNWSAGWTDKPVKLAISENMESGSRKIINGTTNMDILSSSSIQLISDLKDAGSYQSAFLKEDSYEFRAIERYLKANAAARSLRPPQGERTRMVRAQSELEKLINTNDPLADKTKKAQIITHLKSLLEDPKYIKAEYKQWYKTLNIKIVKTKPVKSGRVEITKIRVIKHTELWKKYDEARAEVAEEIEELNKPALTTNYNVLGRKSIVFTTNADSGLSDDSTDNLPILDRKSGEVLLMHGTGLTVIKIIADKGFNPTFNKGTTNDKGVTKYGALGQGTYFGDSFAKVQTYIGCPLCCALKCDCEDENGEPVERLLILARCLVGIPTKARTHDSRRKDNAGTIKEGKHSVIGQEGGFFNWSLFGSNEFLIKDTEHMYPEFVVYWRRA